jgi:16S rRNA (cytosine1402-N4)-methyltransferase
MSAKHLPVLVDEVVAALAPHEGGHYVDATFGAGGYSRAILDKADCRVTGIDRDPDALAEAAPLLARYAGRLSLKQSTFGALDQIIADKVDGIAFDLGVSSMQLDRAPRGFSFRFDGPLDMRMSRHGPSAADLVNSADEEELARIIYVYGEERFSRRIAREIVRVRKDARIETTLQLANLIRYVIPVRPVDIDPATRTFQALRIAVNDELGELTRGLAAAEKLLQPGGRLAVVTFHSLEDRAVKSFLRAHSGGEGAPSRHAPANSGASAPSFELLTRRPVTPGVEECQRNPRARSAKLRAAIRTSAPPMDALKEKVA